MSKRTLGVLAAADLDELERHAMSAMRNSARCKFRVGAVRRTCLMSPISLGILTVLWVVDEGSGSEVSKFRQREANFRAGWEIVISVGKIPISHFY